MGNQINFFSAGSDLDMFSEFFSNHTHLRIAINEKGSMIRDILTFDEGLCKVPFPKSLHGYIFSSNDDVCREIIRVCHDFRASKAFDLEVVWINIFNPIFDDFRICRIYKENYIFVDEIKRIKSDNFMQWSGDLFKFTRKRLKKINPKYSAGPEALQRVTSGVDVSNIV